jgi:hypothetical protein
VTLSGAPSVYEQHAALLDAADEAYQRARVLVYDVLPTGICPRDADLSPRQIAVLETLVGAEQALVDFRIDHPPTA